MPRFTAQLEGNTAVATDPRIEAYGPAARARRALRLLYIEHFFPSEYLTAINTSDYAGLDLMANMLDW